MCGIAGFWQKPGQTEDAMRSVATAMAQAMHHRGPDAQAVWLDAAHGLGLAHARLSIIDLSPAGHQPMQSACGRYVIVYNGEVYNSAEVREALQREMGASCPAFRGLSDTEVILEACARWGVDKAVERLIGMFAFALWDRRDRRLTLGRDRLGIKPLYWGQVQGGIVFGSELKALRPHPAWQGETDPKALSSYLRFGYVPAPLSIFKDIRKLEPGYLLTVEESGQTRKRHYWSLREVAREGLANPFGGSEADMLDHLHDLLKDAVGRRMIADVPLGAFLSGGIDSSTVVALMQAQSSRPVKTFSIGMDVDGYNEADHAKAVAKHLGTDHQELYITPKDAQDVIPNLAQFYDEPFADSSQIPTYLVSKLARRDVTVSLSGDGGDEFFSGYNRYLWGDAINRRRIQVPVLLRKGGSRAIRQLSPAGWDQVARMMPARARIPQLGLKAHKVANALDVNDDMELFRRLVTVWDRPGDMVRDEAEPHNVLWDDAVRQDVQPFMERMQVLDGLTYLPDDILTKVDRASMAVSLEARVPLLDHRVAEAAFRLPRQMRVRDGKGKWALRQVLSRYVPESLFERPKAGFGIPIGDWLKGDLRDWAEELLEPKALEADGLLNAQPIRAAWQEHLSGRKNNEAKLWAVLMYRGWRGQWSHV